MNNQLEQQAERIRNEWFPNHVAEWTRTGLVSGGAMGTLHWAKPGISTYFCHYITRRGMLFVHGDIGEAVYGWSQDLTWEFLASLDLDYFAGKCFASETGRGYRGWDPRQAKAKLDDLLFKEEALRRNFRRVPELPCFAQKNDWHHWLSQYGADVFGDYLSEVADIGDCVHIRCHGHLIGIKMAVATLIHASPSEARE